MNQITKTMHREKFVDMPLSLKAPRWAVIRLANEHDQEQMEKEKAKPVEYQNPYKIRYHRAAIWKRNKELVSQYRHILN